MVLALIVLSALATLGSLTVVSVQSSLKASTNDRSQAVAIYAAESGGAVAMDFLRQHWNSTTAWSAYVNGSNNPSFLVTPLANPAVAAQLPSSGALPGTTNNLFSPDQNAWFVIEFLNNRDDNGFAAGTDEDGRIVIRATGHGPQGALAIIEWQVKRTDGWSPPPPSPPAPPPPSIPASQPLILTGWHVVL